VARAGGIPPLVQLLDDGAPQAHTHAMAALARLSKDNADNQTQIAKKLVALLSPMQSEGAQRRSAVALWDLAANNPGAPVRIVNAGAISPLVALMGTGRLDVYEAAVGALSCLAKGDSSNQLAIATGLVALLGLAPAEKEERLAAMVAKFGAASDIQAAIAEAGDAVRAPDGSGDFGGAGGAEGEGEGSSANEASTARKKMKSQRGKKKSERSLLAALEGADPAAAGAPGTEAAGHDAATGGEAAPAAAKEGSFKEKKPKPLSLPKGGAEGASPSKRGPSSTRKSAKRQDSKRQDSTRKGKDSERGGSSKRAPSAKLKKSSTASSLPGIAE